MYVMFCFQFNRLITLNNENIHCDLYSYMYIFDSTLHLHLQHTLYIGNGL